MVMLDQPARLDRAWRQFVRESGATRKSSGMLKTTYTLSDFIGWQRDGELTLDPIFQRNPVWSLGQKSYFIDTLIKNLPTPLILLRARRPDLKEFAPHREVVDGQQRLRTAISFVAPHLLSDLEDKDIFVLKEEHNEEFKGRSFKELPKDVQTTILDYEFSVNVFPSDTDDRIIIQLFCRLNATGSKLNPQELRNAEFTGHFKNTAEMLSFEQLNRWRQWRVLSSVDISRMIDIELTSELIIFMMNGITEKNHKSITNVYKLNEDSFPQKKLVARRFRQVFQAIEDRMSDDVPRFFNSGTKFYALFVAVYDLMYGIKSELTLQSASPLTAASATAVRDAGMRITKNKAPATVLASIKRTPSHRRERDRVVKYLLKLA